MAESRTHQVLVVDDHPEQRAIYRALLEGRGFHVLEAEDGEAAVRRAEEDRPDLILMDVQLPWMDGWEITRRLKAVPRTAAIPVVAVSAHVGEDGPGLADESGCSAFLSKTGDPRSVADLIERLIGNPVATTPLPA
jgi:two-component system, cell cycle response regulator DivK